MTIPITNIASFDIDAQNCFTPLCPHELPTPDGNAIVDELNAQAQYAQYRIGSKDAHPATANWAATQHQPPLSSIENAVNMDIRWPIHAVPGTLGFELIQGLPPVTQYDFFVWKGVEPDLHPYSACYHDLSGKLSTGVTEFLHSQGVRLVIAGGLATEYCVQQTVLDLLDNGFHVIVNLGACRGFDPVNTEIAIQQMQTAGAIFIQTAAELPEIIN